MTRLRSDLDANDRANKVCFKCGEAKNIDEFYPHRYMADGRLGKCKTCTRKDVRENRLRRIEYYREYDSERSRRPERAAFQAEASRRWRNADRRRQAAHSAVSRAIRNGLLVRLPCERCGNTKSHAHHEDYDRKLDVTWLCAACHAQRHKEIDALKKEASIDPTPF